MPSVVAHFGQRRRQLRCGGRAAAPYAFVPQTGHTCACVLGSVETQFWVMVRRGLPRLRQRPLVRHARVVHASARRALHVPVRLPHLSSRICLRGNALRRCFCDIVTTAMRRTVHLQNAVLHQGSTAWSAYRPRVGVAGTSREHAPVMSATTAQSAETQHVGRACRRLDLHTKIICCSFRGQIKRRFLCSRCMSRPIAVAARMSGCCYYPAEPSRLCGCVSNSSWLDPMQLPTRARFSAEDVDFCRLAMPCALGVAARLR